MLHCFVPFGVLEGDEKETARKDEDNGPTSAAGIQQGSVHEAPDIYRPIILIFFGLS